MCIRRRTRKFEGVPAEVLHYLLEVQNEYRRILAAGHPVPEALKQEIEELLKEIRAGIEAVQPPATQVTWRSLSELEQLVLLATPGDELVFKQQFFERRYERALGAEALKRLQDSGGPVGAGQPAGLRAYASQLIREIYRYHSAIHSRELALTALGSWMSRFVAAGLAVVLVISIIATWCSNGNRCLPWIPPLLPVIFYCGMAGAFISIARRLQEQRDSGLTNTDVIQVLIGLRTGRASVAVGLFSGGIFALVLYLLLLSGMVGEGGGLMPNFKPAPASDTSITSFVEFIRLAGPAGARDHAKVLVWSIVAGFGERFVPDVLDRLQKQAAAKPPAR